MNCNEARRMITAYVEKKLTDRELEQFLHHVEHCGDCMDELDIYFMVYRALDTLDSGAHHEFDFRKMLENDIRMSHRRLMRKKILSILYAVLLLLTEVFLAFSVYTGFELREDENRFTTIQRAILRINGHAGENRGDQEKKIDEMIERAENGDTATEARMETETPQEESPGQTDSPKTE